MRQPTGIVNLVIEPEEELQMLDLADANGYKIKYKNRLQARLENDYKHICRKTKGKYKDDLFRKVFPLLDRKETSGEQDVFRRSYP